MNDASDKESDDNSDEEAFANSLKTLLQGFQLYFPAKNLVHLLIKQVSVIFIFPPNFFSELIYELFKLVFLCTCTAC